MKAFTSKYLKWCRKHGHNFSEEKALEIHVKASSLVGVIPRNDTTKLLVKQAVAQFQVTSAALAALKQKLQSLAETLPEYPVVMEMFGVGPTLGPQLMAEIGDVRRFHSKKALVAFRRTLFLGMSVYLQNAPLDESVYQFMDKKRSEGKPYRVYMMAAANKFLRIYYASVKTYLDSQEYD